MKNTDFSGKCPGVSSDLKCTAETFVYENYNPSDGTNRAHVIVQNLSFHPQLTVQNAYLSYDVASGREITPCNKICKPLVVYRLTGNVMTSITTLRT